MKFTTPERFFSRITQIDIQADILDEGIRLLLLDIDNTILTRDTHEVPSDVQEWLQRAQDAGLRICFVSNNWHKSVYQLARSMDLPIVAKSMKPLPFAFCKARSPYGCKRSECLVIGDQLMTDVLGAHTAGLRAYLLQPLVASDLAHTLALRHVEKLLLKDLRPER